jgi:hypothetical protein
VSQHASLSPERWAAFGLDQQILMIANEMNRAGKLARPADLPSLRRAYERILRLLDLTVEVQRRPTLLRELLRWRDLVAELFLLPTIDPARHGAAFRALLLFTPEASRQIPFVLGPYRGPATPSLQ